MFGIYLEKYIGSLNFLLIFVAGGIVGNLMQVLFSLDGFVIGMSSAIFAIFGAVVIREPLLNFNVFGFIRVPIILMFGVVFSLQWLLGFSEQNLGNMLFGEIAHIFGFLTGAIIVVFMDHKLTYIFYSWMVIATGFIICAFSLSSLFKFIINTNFLGIVTYAVLLIFGLLLITYIYFQLKYYLNSQEVSS